MVHTFQARGHDATCFRLAKRFHGDACARWAVNETGEFGSSSFARRDLFKLRRCVSDDVEVVAIGREALADPFDLVGPATDDALSTDGRGDVFDADEWGVVGGVGRELTDDARRDVDGREPRPARRRRVDVRPKVMQTFEKMDWTGLRQEDVRTV